MLILSEFTRSYLIKGLGASLLALSPPLIFRAFGHDSLSAQWLLLAGIWFVLLEYRHKLWRGGWPILLAAAVLVNFYFVAMLLPLWAVSLFFRYRREARKWQLPVDALLGLGAILLVGYSIGLFGLGAGSLEPGDFGFFSWNLNGFFNPGQSPSILPVLPTGTLGQYEGFSYLGLGNLLVLPVALVLFFLKDTSRGKLFIWLPLGIVSILFGLFALTNQAFLNNHPLWNIRLPVNLLNLFSVFHSSGRFIWPVFYFLVVFGILSILRHFRYAALFLAVALALQFADVQYLFAVKRFTGFTTYSSPLQSGFWQAAARTDRNIELIPAVNAMAVYEPIALYARQNRLTLNWGYFARADYNAIEKKGSQVWGDLKDGRSDSQTIYIFWGADWQKQAKDNLSSLMLTCQVDGYTVALSRDNLLNRSGYDLTHECSFP